MGGVFSNLIFPYSNFLRETHPCPFEVPPGAVICDLGSTTVHLQGNEMIVLCEYPFVLDTRAKSVLVQFECVLKMKVREGGEGRGGEGRGGEGRGGEGGREGWEGGREEGWGDEGEGMWGQEE